MAGVRWIYRIDELGKEHNDIVGKKCANLGELTRAGLLVPPGFALTLDAYKMFLKDTGALEEICRYLDTFSADPNGPDAMTQYEEAAKVLRNIVESKQMPAVLEEPILSYYDDLCQETCVMDVPVAVRSAGVASHPGQYETFHYVRDKIDLPEYIKKVWSSTYNARSLIARARAGVELSSDPIGVAVIKMIDSYTAGVAFTLDPVTGDNSVISIDVSYGIGEAVVSGKITPDEFMVDKIEMNILERKINKKELKYIISKTGKGLICVPVDEALQEKPALDDKEVIELAKTAKKIEEYYGTAMDIEWAIEKDTPADKGVLYLLQARPETIWSKKGGEEMKVNEDFGSANVLNMFQ